MNLTNKMRLLFSLLVSIIFATNMRAEDDKFFLKLGESQSIDLAHWVREMPDDMRLCQMSIPRAHDAATWCVTYTRDPLVYTYYQDQYYDEKTLFRKGVRAFDLRFTDFFFPTDPGEIFDDIFTDTGGGYMCHGDKLLFVAIHDRMNTFKEEMEHMPTADDLNGEFMILNLAMEYSRSSDQAAATRKLIGSFVKLLIQRYGADRFIKYREDLTKKDLSGKILLFVGQRWMALDTFNDYNKGEEVDYYKSYFNEVLANKNYNPGLEVKRIPFNIMYRDDNRLDIYPKEDLTYKDKKNVISANYIVNFPDSVKPVSEGQATFAGNGLSLGYREDNCEPEDVTAFFKQGLEKFHNKIDDLNTQNIFYFSGIEGYKKVTLGASGGGHTALDRAYLFGLYKEQGANHLVYDYIQSVQKPLGMVNFDFCGAVDEDYDTHLLVYTEPKYGDLLLKEIVRHNFIQKNLTENFSHGFISDIAVCCVKRAQPSTKRSIEQDGLYAKNALEAQGYQMLMDYSTDDLLGGYGDDAAKYRIFFGAKYTSNPDSAVSRIQLLRTYKNYLPDYVRLHDDALKVNDFEKWDYGYKSLGNGADSTAWDKKYYSAFWGSRYVKPVTVIDCTGENPRGDLRAGLVEDLQSNQKENGPWHAFLWQEKTPIHDDANGPTRILFDFTKNSSQEGRFTEDVKWMEFQGLTAKNTHGWDEKTNFGITDDFNGGAANKLTMKRHSHLSDADGYDENNHHKYCTLCNYKMYRQEHEHKYKADELGYVHIDSCSADICGYKVSKYCADYCDFDSEGFGYCKKCNQKTFQPAVMNINGVFEIRNAGQLYWFSRYVAYGHSNADAILMTDIKTTQGGFKPIGFATVSDYDKFSSTDSKYEEKLEGTNLEDKDFNYRQLALMGVGYSGTFDGNGHTIHYNYNPSAETAPATTFDRERYVDGLFTFVNGGTVKNLGIADDSQIVSNKTICGSVAGLAYKANFENVYSKATIITGNADGSSHVSSGMVGMMSASYLQNGYFAGKIASYQGEDSLKHVIAASAVCATTDEVEKTTKLQKSVVSNFYYDANPSEGYEWKNNIEALTPELFPDVHMMKHEDFKNGKVCLLLNSNDYDKKDVWFQKIKTGESTTNVNYYPVLRDTSGDSTGVVYGGYKHGGSEIAIVTNNESEIPAMYKHKCPYNAEAVNIACGNHDMSYKLTSSDWNVYTDKIGAELALAFKCEVCEHDTIPDAKDIHVSANPEKKNAIATCTTDGHYHYVGTFQFNDYASFTLNYDEDIDAFGHDFSKKVLADTPDAGKVFAGLYPYVCSHDSSHLSTDVMVLKDFTLSGGNLELKTTGAYPLFTSMNLTDENQFVNVDNLSFLMDPDDYEYPTYTRTMKSQWETLVLPFDFKVDSKSPHRFYKVSSVSDNEVILEEITNYMPQGTPVLVHIDSDKLSGKGYKLEIKSSGYYVIPKKTASDVTDNLKFVSSYTQTDLSDKEGYVLDGDKFCNLNESSEKTCKPFHAYLSGTAEGAKYLNFASATAIDVVKAVTDGTAEYYDINGRKLNDLQKGVNIVKYSNGITKKVILK